MANRPPTISIKDLSKAVDHAVKVVAEKHKVQLAPEFSFSGGLIMGRWLLQAEIGLQEAQQVATGIAQHVTAGGAAPAALGAALSATHLTPAVLSRPGGIICGFMPPPEWDVRE